MTEVTTLFFSFIICLMGVALGFIFGWIANGYFIAFFESKVQGPIHPEMLDNDGFIVNEELLAVRFLDEDNFDEDDDED